MSDTFTCAACGGEFNRLTPEAEARAEAEATFRPEEIADPAEVCEDCWRAMREQMPDLDARYQEQGL